MKNVMSAKPAAKYLGIGLSTLHRLCREKRIRHATLNGRDRVFRREWLDEYIESQVTPPEYSRPSGDMTYPVKESQSSRNGDDERRHLEDWSSLRIETKKRLDNSAEAAAS